MPSSVIKSYRKANSFLYFYIFLFQIKTYSHSFWKDGFFQIYCPTTTNWFFHNKLRRGRVELARLPTTLYAQELYDYGPVSCLISLDVGFSSTIMQMSEQPKLNWCACLKATIDLKSLGVYILQNNKVLGEKCCFLGILQHYQIWQCHSPVSLIIWFIRYNYTFSIWVKSSRKYLFTAGLKITISYYFIDLVVLLVSVLFLLVLIVLCLICIGIRTLKQMR